MPEAIQEIAVGRLKVADDNVREDLGELGELAASIKSAGIIEPLISDEQLVLACGNRRLEAAKKAGLKTVPVIVRPLDEQERVTLAAIENLQRQSLTPLEEARVFMRLSNFGLASRAIADKVGVSQSWVVKRLSLLKLPEPALEAMSTGKIEVGQAQELVKVADDPKLVAKLVTKAANGSPYTSNDVQRELERRERDKATTKTEAALRKAGETVVSLKEDAYQAVPPAGMKVVKAYRGYNGDIVEMDSAEHAKLACHAVGVQPFTQQTIEVCTEPGSHPDPREQEQKAEDKRRAREAAKKEKQRLELVHRIEFLRGRSKQVTEKQVLDACYRAWVDTPVHVYSRGDLAVEILELDGEPEEGEELATAEEVERKLIEMASTQQGKRRIVFAYACDRLYRGGELDATLEDLGYKPPAAAKKKPAKKAEEVVPS